MRRSRDPSRSAGRSRRPVWDNPRGQLPGTGILEKIIQWEYGGSTQSRSSGSVADAGESLSGGLQGNVSGSGSGGASSGGQVTVLVKKD